MEKPIENHTIKEIYNFNKQLKLKAINLLINSIADDKAFEVKAWMETEREYNEQK